jgi:CHAT domain-containing protein
MLADVPYVVSSLWSVPDISTAILMEHFYSNHVVHEMDIPLALQKLSSGSETLLLAKLQIV